MPGLDLVLQVPMTGATYIMLQSGSQWSAPVVIDPGVQFGPVGDLVAVGVANFDRAGGDDIVYASRAQAGALTVTLTC